ncbi:MAG: pepsin/retropepsin-like aspartic protease family protein [Planctomycetota bacterium]
MRCVMHRLALIVTTLALLLQPGCTSSPAPRRTTLSAQGSPYSLAEPENLPERYEIPLLIKDGFLIARGRVNDARPGWYLFDTGSNLTIVDQGLANRIGLPELEERSTVGVAGSADFTVRPIERLELGGLDLGQDHVGALSMFPITKGLGVSTQGLIGFNCFGNHPFTIDYKAQKLTLYRRDRFVPPPDATAVPLVLYRGLPAVRTTLASRPVLLLLDSGANNALTLPSSVATWPGILATGQTSRTIARGVGGEVHTQSGWLRRLDLFELTLRDLPVTFEPPPPGLTDLRFTIGRLGNELLSSFRLTFDAPRGVMYVEFLPQSE